MSIVELVANDGGLRSKLAKFVVPAILVAVLVGAVVWAFAQRGDVTDEKAIDSASADAVATTLDIVPTLLSYDPATLSDDIAKAQSELTDRFKPEFRQLQKELIEPTVGQGKVLTTAKVQRVAVSSSTATSVKLLVFLEQQTAKAGAQAAPINTRAIVTLKLIGGRWLVDDLKPV